MSGIDGGREVVRAVEMGHGDEWVGRRQKLERGWERNRSVCRRVAMVACVCDMYTLNVLVEHDELDEAEKSR